MAARDTSWMSPLLELLFEDPVAGRCVVAPDGTILRASAAWCRMLGLAASAATGLDVLALRPELREATASLHARARAGERVEHAGSASVAGFETAWEERIDPLPMDDGMGLLLTLRVRSLERPHAADEHHFRLLAQAMPQIVCVLAPDGTPEYVNPSWERFSGLDVEATARTGWQGFVHRDDLPAAAECRRRALRTLSPQDAELRYRAADGTYRWFLSRLAPMIEGGRVVRLVGAGLDIDARRCAEEALRESEQKFSAIFKLSPFAMDLVRLPDRTLADVNEAWVRLMGIPRREALGKTTVELGLIADPGDRDRAYRSLAETGSAHGHERTFATRGNGLRVLLTNSDVVTLGGEQYVLGALQDITDRKLAEQALREADHRKDEFLGMLSHELRNPLTPIRNALHLLRHGRGGEQARWAYEVIERQTQQLGRLVDDLLDVTRIARGKIELRRDVVDLRETVRRSAEDHRAVMEQRGLVFRLSLPDAPLWTVADGTRLAQVIGNLLHNSAKFTPYGGEVAVVLTAEGGTARISVADTGSGIEPSLLPHVFERFVQGDRSLARTHGGLGLGLSLVKGIAELHGGEVRAESGGPGKGSIITVELPLRAPAEAEGGDARGPEREARPEAAG